MQQILFPGSEERTLNTIKDYLKDRSPLIDTDNNILYIKDSVINPDTNLSENVLRKVTSTPDNKNIILDEDDNIALNDSIDIKGITVKPSEEAPTEFGNILLGTINPDKSVLLLTKISETPGTLSGDIFELGVGITSSYHLSISNTGSRSLGGSSSGEKVKFCQVTDITGQIWYGLKFNNDDITSNIYFHGYDTRPEENLPPMEYDDTFFHSVNIVNDDANYSSEIKDIPSLSTWDFRSVPTGFNNNGNNDNFDFGGGLVIRTGHTTNIDTGNVRNGQYGNNTGFLQVANTMGINMPSYLELTVPKGQTALIYFTTTTDNRARQVIIYDEDKETILASGESSNINRYEVLEYTNTSNLSKKVCICTAGGAVRFYYISNYNSNTTNPGDIVIDEITNMPPTGEDGDPNLIKLNDLVLTLADLNNLANACRDSDRQVILDLSNCSVANDARVWSTTIFMDCNSLNTLYMPRGVTAIRNNVFSGCSFMDHIYLNPELAEIYGAAYGTSTIGVFGATQIRELVITNPNMKLGGYWATASSLRYVIFPEDFNYADNGTGFLLNNNAGESWLTSVPSYMKLLFRETFVRHLKSDSNPWWFRNWGDGDARSYAYYGDDDKGARLLAPFNSLQSTRFQSAAIYYNGEVIYPAR